MTPVVRRAAATDAMGVADVHVRAWQIGYAGLIDPDALAELRAEDRAQHYTFDSAGDPRTYVADDEGEICGFVTFEMEPDPGLVRALYVDPQRWRAGIGTMLLATARRELTTAGRSDAVLFVAAGNIRADHFYRSHGWQRTGRVMHEKVWGVEAEMEEYRTALG